MNYFDQYILDAYEVVDPMIEIVSFRMHRYSVVAIHTCFS